MVVWRMPRKHPQLAEDPGMKATKGNFLCCLSTMKMISQAKNYSCDTRLQNFVFYFRTMFGKRSASKTNWVCVCNRLWKWHRNIGLYESLRKRNRIKHPALSSFADRFWKYPNPRTHFDMIVETKKARHKKNNASIEWTRLSASAGSAYQRCCWFAFRSDPDDLWDVCSSGSGGGGRRGRPLQTYDSGLSLWTNISCHRLDSCKNRSSASTKQDWLVDRHQSRNLLPFHFFSFQGEGVGSEVLMQVVQSRRATSQWDAIWSTRLRERNERQKFLWGCISCGEKWSLMIRLLVKFAGKLRERGTRSPYLSQSAVILNSFCSN